MIEHDRLFKELLTPCFADFLEVFLPEVAGYVDLASLRLESSRLLLDLAPERDADLLFRARFLGQGRGLLVHLEHQAQGQARIERRMFHYFARFDEKYDVPVVMAHPCRYTKQVSRGSHLAKYADHANGCGKGLVASEWDAPYSCFHHPPRSVRVRERLNVQAKTSYNKIGADNGWAGLRFQSVVAGQPRLTSVVIHVRMMSTSIFLIAVLGAIGALLAILFACRVSGSLPQTALCALAAVLLIPALYLVLALHPEIIDGRFRTYKGLYRDIRVGMTKPEVLAALDRRYPKLGARQRPTIIENKPERLGFFMNPESSIEPNCEGIFLTLQEGRVVSKYYSRD